MSIRLLILGMLYDKEAKHGYEIKQELESWNAELWAHIAYGSIYFALKQLTKEHLIKPVNPKKKAIESGRINYVITQAGQEEFLRLLRKQWWEIKPLIDPLQAAIMFMPHMDRAELMLALDYRAGQLRTLAKTFEIVTPLRLQEAKAPPHVTEIFRLLGQHSAAQLNWIDQMQKKLKTKELP